MEEEKIKNRYIHPHVVVCKRCMGNGAIKRYDELRRVVIVDTCPECNGSGRLVVSSTIETRVRAWVPPE